MTDLDTTLREILTTDMMPKELADSLVARVKQVLRDAGYIDPIEYVRLSRQQANGFYERFEKELMDIPVLWTNEIPKQLNPYALRVLDAARRAAGLEQQ